MEDWNQIIDDFGPIVWKQALRMLGNTSDAADCFQVVILEAFEFSKRQEIRVWAPFLRRLAILRALDRLRARYRERKDPRSVDEIAAIIAKNNHTNCSIDQYELAESLRFALTKIPENQAEAFSLLWIDGLSHEEIAERMQISPNYIRVLLHRARLALKSLLTDEWKYRS